MGNCERQVVGGEFLEKHVTRDGVRSTRGDNNIIICAVAATLNRWGIERGVVRAPCNARGAEKTHTNVGRVGRARAVRGQRERVRREKTLSRAVRRAAVAAGWGVWGKLVRPSGGGQHAAADLDCSSAYARQSE